MKDLWRLLKLFGPYRRWLVAGILLSTGVVLANVALLALAGWFITGMALAGLGLGTINYFTPAAAIRGLAIVRSVGRYGERLVTHEATLRLLTRLRSWFYTQLEPLAPARLQHYHSGDLLSRMRADIDTLEHFYLQVVVPCAAAVLCALVMTAYLLHLNITVALALLAGLLLVGVALPLAAGRLGAAAGTQAVNRYSDLRAALADAVRGMAELHVYQALTRQATHIRDLGTTLVAAQRRMACIDAIGDAAAALATRITLWLALVMVIPLVTADTLGGPQLVLIAFFVLAAFEAVSPLPQAFARLGETRAAARRLFELVDAEPAVTDPHEEAPEPAAFSIDFHGVTLRYSDSAAAALDGVNLHVDAGECVGIVGTSGSGKTSLFNLLLRFHDFETGRIEIGGESIRAWRGATLRRWCAVVDQRTHLFNTSIRDNLRLAAPQADDNHLWQVLRQVALADEVAAMPQQLDTVLGETGTRLSGGQARRLAIARALLKNAPILLLDEPTEGLDAESERRVLQSLATVMHGHTTLLISHRLQALQQVDRVVCIKAGKNLAMSAESI
ncbi:MAG: thiol reductant ABC exporter subunit CydC [Nevskiaceae bacterium]|nr:MAG: thiol reductant ABC exporter subunit CydC [Nevskiaceae bacterium]TBR71835.1 MAG: thiol reductant ABC exporter subunit CydC [Nevskiaceae bacterium]